MLRFWCEEIGLAYEGPLPIRRGVTQHRFEFSHSIVKVNVHEAPLVQGAAGGYRELLLAQRGLSSPKWLRDPDGNLVCLWPDAAGGLNQLGMRMGVCDLERHRAFFGKTLGFEERAPLYPGSACFAVGQSHLILEQAADLVCDAGLAGTGWRYITLQVFAVDEVHAQLLAGGAREAMAPKTLGTTARISMVLDPDDNWIELSQRASLVGTLD